MVDPTWSSRLSRLVKKVERKDKPRKRNPSTSTDQDQNHPRPPKEESVDLSPSSNCRPLPAEIWDSILSYLAIQPLHLAKRQLTVMIRVNRLLREVSEPYLYRTIEFNFGAPRCYIIHLLRTLEQRPELGRHIKDLSLLTPRPDSSRHRWQKEIRPLNSLELSDVDKLLASAWPGCPATLRTTETATWAGFLLQYTRNIQHLRIGPEGVEIILSSIEKVLCSSTSTSTSPPSPFYRRLQTLQIDTPVVDEYSRPMEEMFPVWTPSTADTVQRLLSLPTFREFRGAAPRQLVSALSEAETTSYALTGLEVYMQTPAELRNMVPHFRDIKSLTYIQCWNRVDSFDCDLLYLALTQIKDTVEELKISGLYSGHFRPIGPRHIRGQLGSLRMLTRLKRLSLPWFVLTECNSCLASDGEIGIQDPARRKGLGDILPPNLEELEVRDFPGFPRALDYIMEVTSIITRRERRFQEFLTEGNYKAFTPHLRVIKVFGSKKLWREAHTTELKELSDAAGLRVEFDLL